MAKKYSSDAIQDKVLARVEKEKERLSAVPGETSCEPSLSFVRQCFNSNEVGDSLLYNYINRGKYIYNVITGRWMVWLNPQWAIDHNERSLADTECVVIEYLRLWNDIDEKIKKTEEKWKIANLNKELKKVITRIERVHTFRGRVNILRCCASNATAITVHPNELDQNPWLLPCVNGVIDLRTGVFRPALPGDLLTKTSKVEFSGIDESCPVWENFLNSILAGDSSVQAYLQRILGYACTGLNIERVFLVLFGRHGQNGKGTLMEILYYVLGDLAGPIQAEMLMSQKFSRSSSGPSPDLMALKNKRLAWASETEEGQSFAAGRLKLFSGGDPLVGRGLNDKEQTTFMPSHTLFLLTNNLPHAPAHDNAFWERIKVIDFPLSFVRRKPTADYERQADPELLDKLKAESSGILAWLVRGCLEWQKKGMDPPEKVLVESLKYRRSEDDLQDFIEQCCKINQQNDSLLRESAKNLYGSYKSWWADQSPSKPMSNKKFGDSMTRKGFVRIKTKGRMVYLGVSIEDVQGDNAPFPK